DRHQLSFAVDEAIALLRGVPRLQRRVRLRVVDDRQHHLGETGALHQVDEARLDPPPPRRLFDQQRPYARGISKFAGHKQKTPSPRGEEVWSVPMVFALRRPFSTWGARQCTPTSRGDDGGATGERVLNS